MSEQRPIPLSIKLFSDGADLASLLEVAKNPRVSGFTTNPTLMRKAGVADYRAFAREVLAAITDRPISFEVFADEFPEMARQARELASWGANVYVKVPITNTRGEPSLPLVRELALAGVKLNVTAVCTLEQVHGAAQALRGGAPAIISVFAGRIADTGRDPAPLMQAARAIIDAAPGAAAELLWASPRELLNIVQADAAGAHIITVPPDMLKKLDLFGKSLAEYSLDTVKMFRRDAEAAGYTL